MGIKEYLEENGWDGLDEDDANELLELILIYKLEELERDEPYALSSINTIKNVLFTLFN